MKRNYLLTFIGAAVLGGLIAVFAYSALVDNTEKTVITQVREPAQMVNMIAAMDSSSDFTIAAEKTVNAVAEADEIFTDIILRCDERADVSVRLQTTGINNDVIPSLAKRISEEIKKESGFSNKVKVMIIPVCTYSS